jgi:putative oxidoreductase
LPAAAAIGLMATAAATDHRGKGPFVFKGGWEYTGVVAVVAAALAALGPGRLSVDALRGSRRHGAKWAALAIMLGIGSSAGLLAATYRPDRPPVLVPDAGSTTAADATTGASTDADSATAADSDAGTEANAGD